MSKAYIKAELEAFIQSGKAKSEVNSGNFVTTHIDPLKVAEHFVDWQRNRMWHPKEDKPDGNKVIIVEVKGLPVPYALMFPESYSYYDVERWAYIDDLIPNK